MSKVNRNLIIDSNNLLHRVHWVCNKHKYISVPKMFFQCVRSYAHDHMITPGCIYTAWDDKLVKGSTNHRRSSESVEYKSTRDHERNADVYRTYRHIRRMCQHAGFINMHPGVLECDDVIAHLSKKLEGHNVIVSVDQDMLQLINENNDVYDPIKKRIVTVHNFDQYLPVSVKQFIHYKALMGDKSDNIPGIPKVGPKRAAAIVKDNLNNLSDEHLQIYKRNLELMDLQYSLDNYPGEVKLYDKQLEMATSEVQIEQLMNECKSIDCYDLKTDLIETMYTEKITLSQALS